MKYFFEDAANESRLKDVLDSWEGTPFRHWAGVKGMGCDCIHFVGRVLEELGITTRAGGVKYQIPRYSRDWHLHKEHQLLLEGVLKQIPVDVIDSDDHMNGDILLFRFGRAVAHSAFYFDNFLYHSLSGIGVRRSSYDVDDWKDRQKYNLRVLSI